MIDESKENELNNLECNALGMNVVEAKIATKNGSIAAFISAGLTVLVVTIAVTTNQSGTLQSFNDPLNFFDVALIAALGVGIRRHSRAAAVTTFVYFVFAKIFLALETGAVAGMVVALIFLYYFGVAIRGSIAYHKIRHLSDPTYKPASKWTYRVGIPAGLLVFAMMILVLLSEVGVVPAFGVVDGSDLSQRDKILLIEMGIIEPDEKIELFYSTGLTTISADGNLLTDKRIISYEDIGDGLDIYSATFDEVESMTLIQKGDFINDTVIEILPLYKYGFRLFISTEEDGDKRFISAINDRLPADKRLMLDDEPQ